MIIDLSPLPEHVAMYFIPKVAGFAGIVIKKNGGLVFPNYLLICSLPYVCCPEANNKIKKEIFK